MIQKPDYAALQQFFSGLTWQKTPGLDRITASFSGPISNEAVDYLAQLQEGEAFVDRGELKTIIIDGKVPIKELMFSFNVKFNGMGEYMTDPGVPEQPTR